MSINNLARELTLSVIRTVYAETEIDCRKVQYLVIKVCYCNGAIYFCGYSTTVSVGALQASDVGSIPITRSFADIAQWLVRDLAKVET